MLHCGQEPGITEHIDTCPYCQVSLVAASPAEHAIACRAGGAYAGAHREVASALASCLRETHAGPVRMEWHDEDEAGARRPGDVALLNCTAGGGHLAVDVSISRLVVASHYDRFQCRQLEMLTAAEQAKIDSYDCTTGANGTATLPGRGGHQFIPFITNEHGRLGPRASALLSSMAARAEAGSYSLASASAPERAAYRDSLTRRWRARISIAGARAMARTVIRFAESAAHTPRR
jgi:hypothetical protein